MFALINLICKFFARVVFRFGYRLSPICRNAWVEHFGFFQTSLSASRQNVIKFPRNKFEEMLCMSAMMGCRTISVVVFLCVTQAFSEAHPNRTAQMIIKNAFVHVRCVMLARKQSPNTHAHVVTGQCSRDIEQTISAHIHFPLTWIKPRHPLFLCRSASAFVKRLFINEKYLKQKNLFSFLSSIQSFNRMQHPTSLAAITKQDIKTE